DLRKLGLRGRRVRNDRISIPPPTVGMVSDFLLTAHFHDETLVRRYPPLVVFVVILETVDLCSTGTLVAGGGQLQCTLSIFEFNNVLHAPLAPTPFADNHGPVVILQTRRDDF